MRLHHLATAIIAASLLTTTAAPRTFAEPPTRRPSISCHVPEPRACPDVSPHDLCHFGKKDSWHKGKLLRTRYTMFCSPDCIKSGSTCWISGFPEPGRANFIGWLDKSKKPDRMYDFDLRSAGHGYVLELEFF